MTNRELETIEDREQFDRLDGVLKSMLDVPELLNVEYLRRRCWEAVPFESALHLNEVDADRMATAAARMGCHECNAIPTEGLTGPPHYRVPMDLKGLLEFSRKCAHFRYLLIPDNESFAILFSTEGYGVAAGPKRLVELILAKSIEAARDDFRQFARAETLEPVRRLLTGIARRYETLSAN